MTATQKQVQDEMNAIEARMIECNARIGRTSDLRRYLEYLKAYENLDAQWLNARKRLEAMSA